MSDHSTKSIERRSEMFERFVQYKKRKYGEEAQEGGQTDKEDVSSSFGFLLDTHTKNWKKDDILDERYQRLVGLGGLGELETVTKKGTSRKEECHWNDRYESLLGFKQKHGHVKVPQQYDENPKLGRWVGYWRNKYKEYKRTNGQKGDPHRMKRLESIGLVDDISTGNEYRRVKSYWDDMLNQLSDFKQEHGHLKVPQQYDENPKLGRWVRNWRSKYREYKRTNGQKGDPHSMKRLESSGLVDDISTGNEHRDTINHSGWYDRYKQLSDFKQKHGHLKVPQQYDENPKLGVWVKNKRFNYREDKISNGQKGDPGQMKHLESIGLVDDILLKKKEDKKTNCADNEVVAPIVVSSMSLPFPSNTQAVTKETPSSTGMKRKKNDKKADLDFLGSDLRGGFWA
jgi:hypothetical protein